MQGTERIDRARRVEPVACVRHEGGRVAQEVAPWSTFACVAAGAAAAVMGGSARIGPAPDKTVVRLHGAALAADEAVIHRVHEIYRLYRAGRSVEVIIGSPGPPAVQSSPAAGPRAFGETVERLRRELDRAGIPVCVPPARPPGWPHATVVVVGAGAEPAGGAEPGVGIERSDGAGPPSDIAPEAAAGTSGGIELANDSGLIGATLGHEEPAHRRRRLRVLLLGLGTVGGGVYRHLLAAADQFEVVGIAVRHPQRHARDGVPAALLSADPWELLARPCDIVVELLGGRQPATALIVAALRRGRAVITANKLVLAEEGTRLASLAAAHAAPLLGAAAVGGAVPVLEAVARAVVRGVGGGGGGGGGGGIAGAGGEVRAIRGVLNGTCNFVLDQLAAGASLDAAVGLAQARGFAEADPAQDLDGSDAACKLRLLARAAFGVELAAGDVDCRGIAGLHPAAARAVRARGRVLRLVAECRREAGRVAARVCPVSLPARDFLAGARDEENRVVVETAGGPPLRLAGRGAGRWPTSEAVFADLLDLGTWSGRPSADGTEAHATAITDAAAASAAGSGVPAGAILAPEVRP